MDEVKDTNEQHRLIARWEVYSRDTAPEIERRWLAAVREMPLWRKFQMAAEMSQTARALTLAGLRHRYPGADEREIRFRFATLLFGPETAQTLCARSGKRDFDVT